LRNIIWASGPVTGWEVGVAAFVLLLLSVALLGSHVVHGGFSYDDWALSADEKYWGFWSTVNFYLHIDHRPLVALYLPLVQAVFGGDAHVQLAWISFAHVAMCVCLYMFVRSAGLERFGAGLIALLALLFPFADAEWLYVIGSAGTIAVSLYLLGATLAFYALRSSGRRGMALHGLSVLLYVASVLTYELAFIAIMGSVLLYLGRAPRRTVMRRWTLDIGAMVLTVLLFTSRTVPVLPGADVHGVLTLHQQLSHARLIFDQARSMVGASLEPFGVTHYNIILTVAIAIAVAGLVMFYRLPRGDPVRRHLGRWLWTGALALCGTVAAWLVLVPADPYYSPAQPGVGNRINAFAAVCVSAGVYALAAVAAALLLGRTRRWRTTVPAAALLITFAVVAGYVRRTDADKSRWTQAAVLQHHYLDTIRRAVPHPAPDTRILLLDAPGFVAAGIPVFGAPWDLNGALKLAYDDGTLAGYPVLVGTGVICGVTGIAPSGGGYDPSQTAPYGLAMFVDGRTGESMRIRDRAQCMRALRLFTPGVLIL
jgi:hypothetical protein